MHNSKNLEELWKLDVEFRPFVSELVAQVNSGAGSMKVVAFHALNCVFSKPFLTTELTKQVIEDVLNELNIENLIANCKCFNEEQAIAANQLLLSILSTAVGIQWFLNNASIQRYILDDVYNVHRTEIILYLKNNLDVQALLPDDIKIRLSTLSTGTRVSARATVGTEFQ